MRATVEVTRQRMLNFQSFVCGAPVGQDAEIGACNFSTPRWVTVNSETHHPRHCLSRDLQTPGIGKVPHDSRLFANARAHAQGGSPKSCVAVRIFGSDFSKTKASEKKNQSESFPEDERRTQGPRSPKFSDIAEMSRYQCAWVSISMCVGISKNLS